ncbi:MAG TPA: hypothetical protein VGO07_03280 [Candidatus Saccharimonadales bacterium]|nr:hypothetical protein [Candidatus Saccharimonadales bacterium]
MKAKANIAATRKQAIMYHTVRIAQRFSLLALAFSTVLYWVTLITIEISGTAARETAGHQWRNIDQLDGALRTATNHLLWNVLLAAGIALALTAALTRFPRVLQFEKRVLIDSIVVILFCLLMSVFAVSLETNFVSNLSHQYPKVSF